MLNLYQRNKINTIIYYLLDSNSYFSTTSQHTNKEDFYYYNGHYYELGSENQIVSQIRLHFPNVQLSDLDISRIIGPIQDLSTITDNFDNTRYSCYLNGVLDTQTNILLPFSPTLLLFRIRIDAQPVLLR